MHLDTLHVVVGLSRVVELALASLVNGNLAVCLHLEVYRTVLAEQAVAHEELLAISERAVRGHIAYWCADDWLDI